MYSIDIDYGYNKGINYKNIKLDFKAGDVINIFGENGSGKSTFYKVLMGKLNPLRGSVDKSIKDNIVVISDYVGMPDECIVNDILSFLGPTKREYMKNAFNDIYTMAENMRGKKISYLSTGQRRILEIYSALSTEKKILVLDKASSGLDIVNRDILINQIHQLAKSKKIVVFNTTHYIEDIVAIGGRVFIMNPHANNIKEYKEILSIDKILEYVKGVMKYD